MMQTQLFDSMVCADSYELETISAQYMIYDLKLANIQFQMGKKKYIAQSSQVENLKLYFPPDQPGSQPSHVLCKFSNQKIYLKKRKKKRKKRIRTKLGPSKTELPPLKALSLCNS